MEEEARALRIQILPLDFCLGYCLVRNDEYLRIHTFLSFNVPPKIGQLLLVMSAFQRACVEGSLLMSQLTS
jgi:hypothetical protein